MIDWKKYVDKIYIINCAVQDKERTKNLYNELHRIGVTDDLIYNYYNISNSLVKIPLRSDLKYDKHFYDVTLGHYYCLKQAQEFGYEKILILENDVVFLKDVNLIEQILELVNENIYKFDVILNSLTYFATEEDINNIDLIDSEVVLSVDATGNFYNKNSIQKIIDIIEKKYLVYIDYYDVWFEEGIKHITTLNVPICCQDKMFYEDNWQLYQQTYNFNFKSMNIEYIFIGYYSAIKNYLYYGLYSKDKEDKKYYEDTKQFIDQYIDKEKYEYDIKFIDFMYQKYKLKMDVVYDDSNFDKCNFFDITYKIDENKIAF